MTHPLEDAFMAFHQKLVAALRSEAENLGFTISQLEVLRFIVAEKQPTMKDVAAHLHISAPSATALVEHLHARKLVARKADVADRRGVRVSPTKKALELFSTFSETKSRVVSDLFRPLSATDRVRLTSLLKKLT